MLNLAKFCLKARAFFRDPFRLREVRLSLAPLQDHAGTRGALASAAESLAPQGLAPGMEKS